MYKKDNGQISLAEFYTPFEKLDPKNRWARIADMIPWKNTKKNMPRSSAKITGAGDKISDGYGNLAHQAENRAF